jgi:hypothetical protein
VRGIPKENKPKNRTVVAKPGLVGVADDVIEAARKGADRVAEALHGNDPAPEGLESSIDKFEQAIGIYQHQVRLMRERRSGPMERAAE